MPLKILIIPDKFKCTLTAQAAADAIARGWRAVRPEDSLDLLPMSDGGDGFGEIISRLFGAQAEIVETRDAAHRPCRAAWWWHAATASAIVESARVIGLALLPAGKFHPFQLDTYGLGAVLQAAVAKGARRCLLGIGGSATNDGGFGLARALGWQFFDARGGAIEAWTQLPALARLEPRERGRWFDELIVAVDVQNRLLGPEGCSRIYGPQKGLRTEEIERAERCLGQLAKVVAEEFRSDIAQEPGAGAAGGLGFGLRCFAGARLEPGFGLFARLAELPKRLPNVDLVITGEGSLDSSSLMGKGVGELAGLCRTMKVPCLALAGMVSQAAIASGFFHAIHAITPDLATPELAQAQAALYLERLAAKVAASFPSLQRKT